MNIKEVRKKQGTEEIVIPFKAYTAASPSRKWEGEVAVILLSDQFIEFEIRARGSFFHIVLGSYRNGRYICIPNWNVGTEMASCKDVFWNREHLVQYTKLGKVDASSVACGLAALADYFEI